MPVTVHWTTIFGPDAVEDWLWVRADRLGQPGAVIIQGKVNAVGTTCLGSAEESDENGAAPSNPGAVVAVWEDRSDWFIVAHRLTKGMANTGILMRDKLIRGDEQS